MIPSASGYLDAKDDLFAALLEAALPEQVRLLILRPRSGRERGRACEHRPSTSAAVRDDPEWGWLLVPLEVDGSIVGSAIGNAATRDLRDGLNSGRFDVANPHFALRVSGGALLGIVHGVLRDNFTAEDGLRARRRCPARVWRPQPPRQPRSPAATFPSNGRGHMTMKPHRIDVHAHYPSPGYAEALRAAERWVIGGIPVPGWTPELALEFMDRFGIKRQYLSVSDPAVEFVPAGERTALALARAGNDFAAGVIRDHPGRFGAFALLPRRPSRRAHRNGPSARRSGTARRRTALKLRRALPPATQRSSHCSLS